MDVLFLEVLVNFLVVPNDLWIGFKDVQLSSCWSAVDNNHVANEYRWKKHELCLLADSAISNGDLGKLDGRVLQIEVSFRDVRLEHMIRFQTLERGVITNDVCPCVAFAGKV